MNIRRLPMLHMGLTLAALIGPLSTCLSAQSMPSLPAREPLIEALTVVAGPEDLRLSETGGRMVEQDGLPVYAELRAGWGVQWHWSQDHFVPGIPYTIRCEFAATADYANSWGNGPTFACWDQGAKKRVTGVDGEEASVTISRGVLKRNPNAWHDIAIGSFEPAAVRGYAYVYIQERALQLLRERGGTFPRIRAFKAVPDLDAVAPEAAREKLAQWLVDHPLPGMTPGQPEATRADVDRLRDAVNTMESRTFTGMQLAQEGQALAVIVCPADATHAERVGCEELRHYLNAVTGAAFPVVAAPPADVPLILLGRAAAQRRQVRVSLLAPQAWRIETADGNLHLYGGPFRGTLYAVYHLLEDVVGVHWWNAFEETVPHLPDLHIPALAVSGAPVFRLRYLATARSRAEAGAFRRRNRGACALTEKWGGPEEGFGRPRPVHTLPNYLGRTDKLARTRPQWLAKDRDGNPKPDSGTYDLLHPEVRAETVRKLREFIEQDRRDAAWRHDLPPWTYVISPADNNNWNDSPNARALLEREGSRAAELLDFVNHAAEAIASDYPDVLVSTLAYLGTRHVPRSVRPRQNVEIRYCTEPMNMLASLADPTNRVAFEQMQNWFAITEHRAVWFYEECWWGERGLPIPNEWYVADRLRMMHQLGVDSVFQENLEGRLVLSEMRDMKNWLYLKLMEDPYQDTEKLLTTFTDGYYGDAGPHILNYRRRLRQVEQDHPAVITYHGRLANMTYLTLKLVLEADKLFQAATAAVNGKQPFEQRVRHARLGLDRAIAFRYPDLVRAWTTAVRTTGDFPIALDAVIERMRQTWHEQCALRYLPEDRLGPERHALDHAMQELDHLAGNNYVPLEPPGAIPENRLRDVYDHTAGSPWFEWNADRAALLEDTSSPVGRGIVFNPVQTDTMVVRTGGGNELGTVDLNALPASGTWRWIRIPDVTIAANAGSPAARIILGSQAVTARFRAAGDFNLWLHLRRATSLSTTGNNGVALDRLLIVRRAPPEVAGELALPTAWHVFGPLDREAPVPPPAVLAGVPDHMTIGDTHLQPKPANATHGELDFAPFIGGTVTERTAYAFLRFTCPEAGEYTFGAGADWWFQAWIDGTSILDTTDSGNGSWPPSITDHMTTVRLDKGDHVLAIRFISGSGSSLFTIGGPDDLRRVARGH